MPADRPTHVSSTARGPWETFPPPLRAHVYSPHWRKKRRSRRSFGAELGESRKKGLTIDVRTNDVSHLILSSDLSSYTERMSSEIASKTAPVEKKMKQKRIRKKFRDK